MDGDAEEKDIPGERAEHKRTVQGPSQAPPLEQQGGTQREEAGGPRVLTQVAVPAP